MNPEKRVVQLEAKNERLEAKLSRKDDVIAKLKAKRPAARVAKTSARTARTARTAPKRARATRSTSASASA